MERFLFSYTQIDYFIGIFQGIGNGIVDWFKDIWAIFEGIYDFISMLADPEFHKKIDEAFGDAAKFVKELIAFVNDPSSAESISDLLKNFNPLDIFTLMDAGIEKAGQSAGKWAAKEIVGFLNLSPIELGKKVGWLIGYLIPEIILAVFSAGIGTAIKIGVQAFIKGLRVVIKIISKLVKATLMVIKTALGAINDALKFVKSMAAFFAKSGKSKMAPFFEKLEELLKQFKAFLKRKSFWQSHDYSKLGDVAPCFPAGTMVKTPRGNKPIETIKLGDIVFTFDFENQRIVESTVLNTFENWTENLVEIVINNEIIQATRDHVFWIESEQKWLPASELCEEMQVRLSDGNIVHISSISIFEKKCDTFNLQIAQHSNYFVGINGVLVHNDSKFDDLTKKYTEIYEVYDPKTKEVKYVGQTTRGTETRWQEHLTKDHLDWKTKGYRVRIIEKGNWTPYEASVWEQHYIEKHGGKVKLENKINVITEGKYNQYKHLHNPC